MKKFYNLSAVADILGTTVPHVRRLIISNFLTAYNISAGDRRAQYRVRPRDLAIFIKNSKV